MIAARIAFHAEKSICPTNLIWQTRRTGIDFHTSRPGEVLRNLESATSKQGVDVMFVKPTSSPEEALDRFYSLASTLRDSGIPQANLGKLERIWLQRRDVPAQLLPYAAAAFVAGFTGRPKPDMDSSLTG